MENSTYEQVGVLGGGAWGTALALLCAENDLSVSLWAREDQTVANINTDHENKIFLPGVTLSDRIVASTELACVADADFLLLVVPTQYIRTVVRDLKAVLRPATPIVICSKGIEQDSLALPSDILRDELPGHPLAVLSGPSFAADVAQGLPTAVTLAAENHTLGRNLADALGRPTFRVYVGHDLIGAQIGGATKNVLAIACGVVEGCRMGDSAKAALMARGFAELQRLALALEAEPQTLSGLSGLGDLILTCGSRQSRNMSLGVALGEGQTMEEILGSRTSVAEGVYTADAVTRLAARLGVEMPICEAVRDIVKGDRSVEKAISDLLNRPMSHEI